MTVCTPHSCAGPKGCPYCRIAELEDEARRKDAYYQTQGERIAELERGSVSIASHMTMLERQLQTRITQAVAMLKNSGVQNPASRIELTLEILRA